MQNKNQDSLRSQIIDSMNGYAKSRGWADRTPAFNTDMFDEAVMPVIDSAMRAGELLLHRATTPMPPVPEAIVTWLEGCLKVIADMKRFDDLKVQEVWAVLMQLEDGAMRALADARKLTPQKTTKGGLLGNLLAGKSLPMKG